MMQLRRCLAAIAAVSLTVACNPSADRAGETQQASPAPQLPALPVAEPPLDRRALLLSVYEAASAESAGREAAELQRSLDGKLFEVRLRFGCPGAEAGAWSFTFDEEARALRFRIEPEVSSDTPLIRKLEAEDVESVQGFWLRRPWLLDSVCPAPIEEPAASEGAEPSPAPERSVPAPATPAAPEPRFALAQFFSQRDSRTHLRNDRPLSATVRLAEGEAPSGSGYDLIVSGRLVRLADGRVIACAAEDLDSPPACVVSARFDHISLAAPDGTVVAEWSAT